MAAQYGTAEEAKAMLEKAVAAVKENKAKALDMFNKGEGGFKDRDLYVYCANASDGIFTAHPTFMGKQPRRGPMRANFEMTSGLFQARPVSLRLTARSHLSCGSGIHAGSATSAR